MIIDNFSHNEGNLKNISILFENADCIVLNKPAGLPVQGGTGVGNALDSILGERWSPRPLLVHRLDKDTSGIILVAKHKEAATRFSALFSSGKGTGVIKQYLAVCAGSLPRDSGSIRINLDIRGVMKHSETRYRCLAGNRDFAFLELELGTGRTHQIRRHLAHIGNPILGDDKYGDFALNRELHKTRRLKRLLLHASRLVIPEKAGGFPLDITAPLPDYFSPFMEFFVGI
jgi:23S rRNA pseudouridine955/2504/2580 synthase